MKNKRHSSVNSNTKGFTLIELLIVIVIIGILLGTLLPRLTGARERAVDLGAQSLLREVYTGLESYYADNGVYPGTSGTAVCIATLSTELGGYIKNFSALELPYNTGTLDAANCTTDGIYIPLVSRGIAANGFVLVTDVAIVGNANHLISDFPPTIDGTTTVQDVIDVEPSAATIATGDALDATDSVYYLAN